VCHLTSSLEALKHDIGTVAVESVTVDDALVLHVQTLVTDAEGDSA
jgi:hypothetical protein